MPLGHICNYQVCLRCICKKDINQIFIYFIKKIDKPKIETQTGLNLFFREFYNILLLFS